MGRKRKHTYFDETTEEKIFEYLDETNPTRRELIYTKYLFKPIRIISEVYFSKIGTDYIEGDRETLISDCQAHLSCVVLPKFNKSKGKAFSYLSVAARNFFICNNQKGYRRYLKFNVTNISEDHATYYIDESIDNKEYNDEFLDCFYSFIEWFRRNMSYWKVCDERKLALIETLDYMENFENPTKFPKDFFKEFFSKYESTKGRFSWARKFIRKQFVYYREMREQDIDNPKPLQNVPLKKGLKNITQEQVDYIRKHHVPFSREHGARNIAKKLKLNGLVVRYVVEEEDFMST